MLQFGPQPSTRACYTKTCSGALSVILPYICRIPFAPLFLCGANSHTALHLRYTALDRLLHPDILDLHSIDLQGIF